MHNLRDGSLINRVELPKNSKLLAVSLDGEKVALSNEDADCEIFVWSIEDDEEVARWHSSDINGSKNKHSSMDRLSAIFIGNDRLLFFSEANSNITLRQIPHTEPLFTKEIDKVRGIHVSPGGRYIVYSTSDYFRHEAGAVHFLDAQTGDEAGVLSHDDFAPTESIFLIGDGPNPISPDGSRLAILSSHSQSEKLQVYLWDLNSGQLRSVIAVHKSIFALQWLDSRFLLAYDVKTGNSSDSLLIDADSNAVVWRFNFTGCDSHKRTIESPDGHPWLQVNHLQSGTSWLVPLNLISPKIIGAIKKAMPHGAEPLIAPGKTASIVLDRFDTNGLDQDMAEKVKTHLQETFKAKGMTVETGAPLHLTATCQNEATEAVTLELRHSIGAGNSSHLNNQTPNVQVPVIKGTWKMSLSVDKNYVIWEKKESDTSSNHIGQIFIPDEKDKVDYAFQQSLVGFKANAEDFFCNLALPTHIYHQPVDEQGKPGLGCDNFDVEKYLKISPGQGLLGSSGEDLTSLNNNYDESSDDFIKKCLQKYLADFFEENSLRRQIKLFRAGKRPALLLRWGFGVQISGSRNDLPNITNATDVRRVTGEIGEYLGKSLETRISAGNFGKYPENAPTQFSRVDILGAGSQKSLVKEARNRAIDVILLADIEEKIIGLAGKKLVTMRFRLIDSWDDAVLWTSRPLNNSSASGKLTATELAEMILAEIDANYKLQEMPPLNEAAADSRMKKLAEQIPQWKSERLNDLLLFALIEVRYYRLLDLISDDEALDAYARILDPEKAKTFTAADMKERQKLVKQWLRHD